MSYVKVPLRIFNLLPQMSESEIKVMLAIVKLSQGKSGAKASIAELKEVTGLCNQSVFNGYCRLEHRGLIRRESDTLTATPRWFVEGEG